MTTNVLYGYERLIADAGIIESGRPKGLSEREWYVMDARIRLRMGLEPIGIELGLTRERVRQIVASACGKLQRQLATGEIKTVRICRLCGETARPTFVPIHGWAVCPDCVRLIADTAPQPAASGQNGRTR